MKFYQEVTQDWVGDIPNHVYLLNDSRDKMRGYVPDGTDKLILFKNMLPFDARRRRLKPITNIWNWQDDTPKSTYPTWTITGSKGDQYTVSKTETGLTCSCSGFRFRGRCRHIDSVRVQQ
jgi:hypothetical protein